MLLLAALWLGLGAADLVRWSPEATTPTRRAAALATALAGGAALGLLAGAPLAAPAGGTGGWATAAAVALTSPLAALAWVATTSRAERADRTPALDRTPPSHRGAPGARWALLPLAVLAGAVLLALALGPLVGGPAAGSPLVRWWSAQAGSGFPGLAQTSPAQGLLATTGALVLLGTANRVVRLVLTASGTPPDRGEAALRGGRLLGPLERVFLLALALGGDLTAAAAVIAAKGLLRLPEVRTASRLALAGSSPQEPPAAGARPLRGPDVVTEYFLVGTFTSWLLALGVAGAVALAAP